MHRTAETITLADISRPVDPAIDAFRKFLRGAVKTDTLLLDVVLRYILRSRGKQVRPLLVFLSADACGGISRRSMVGGTMVELLHTATLVHDDVVDEANERRGFPSINAVWNNKTAVLVGDYLLARGLGIANENQEFGFLGVTTKAVKRMSEGELMQTKKSRKLDIREDEYFRIIGDKTASLLSACCEIGAISASDDPAVHKALAAYGEYVGIAFQIRDDLFAYTSSNASIGKPVDNDLQERKLTLPLIHALSKAPRGDGKRIVKLVRNRAKGANDPETIRAFVRDHNGLAYSLRVAEEYRDRALEALAILPPSDSRASLEMFAHFVIARQR